MQTGFLKGNVLPGTANNALKRLILRMEPWKKLRRCNQKILSVQKTAISKSTRSRKTTVDFQVRFSMLMTVPDAAEKQNPCVSPCEAVCVHPTGRVTPVRLQENKTRCWGLCGRLCGGTVLLMKFRNRNAEDHAGRLGRAPSLPAVPLLSCPPPKQHIMGRPTGTSPTC